MTGVEVSEWKIIQTNGKKTKKFFYCTSDDKVDGTFITAHRDEVYELCSLRKICEGEFIIANTCMWEHMTDKDLLYRIMNVNPKINLFFSKQELSVDNHHILRQTTTLNNIGCFGFQTSLSERELFINRAKGLMAAICESFTRISPVIF